MEKQISVLVADSDREYAELLSRNISGDFKIDICDIVTSGYQVIEKVDILKPDVVIMDVVMPSIDGIGILDKHCPILSLVRKQLSRTRLLRTA